MLLPISRLVLPLRCLASGLHNGVFLVCDLGFDVNFRPSSCVITRPTVVSACFSYDPHSHELISPASRQSKFQQKLTAALYSATSCFRICISRELACRAPIASSRSRLASSRSCRASRVSLLACATAFRTSASTATNWQQNHSLALTVTIGVR